MKLFYNGFLYESSNNGKDLVIVDIQPEYQKVFTFNIYDWINWLNSTYSSYNRIIFLFNGPDLGFPSKNEYVNWLMELGLDYEVIESAEMIDKSYAFFRYCIDKGIDDDLIVSIVKFMYGNNISDSRDITNDIWDKFQSQFGEDVNIIRQLLENSSDMITIPDLMDDLSRLINNPIELMGGGLNECLKEVEIAIRALGKHYEINNQWSY